MIDKKRKCTECGHPQPFSEYSHRRWNDENRVCKSCRPFSGKSTMAKKVSEKARAETSENCRAWPLDALVDKEDTFWRYCNARKNLRPVPNECANCTISVLPSNVGIMP